MEASRLRRSNRAILLADDERERRGQARQVAPQGVQVPGGHHAERGGHMAGAAE